MSGGGAVAVPQAGAGALNSLRKERGPACPYLGQPTDLSGHMTHMHLSGLFLFWVISFHSNINLPCVRAVLAGLWVPGDFQASQTVDGHFSVLVNYFTNHTQMPQPHRGEVQSWITPTSLVILKKNQYHD